MKSVCIIEPGRMALREDPLPELLAPDDVILKIKCVGVCGSDLHAFRGENPFMEYPKVFGHEFVGEVWKLGPAVGHLAVGDHAVAEPITYCGHCYACRVGHPNVCESLQVSGVHVDGGCREYVRLSAGHVFPIRREIPWHCAVLAEPLTIGFRCCNRAGVLAGDTVLIMGAGPIGLSGMLAARSRGARTIVTDLIGDKLSYARKLGADEVINVKTRDLREEVLRLTGGHGANVVFDTVGSKASLEDCVDLASAAGRIVELGMTGVSEIVHAKLIRRDLSLLGTRLQAREFPEAIALLEEQWEALQDFVSGSFPLEEAPEAFAYALSHPEKVRKLVIDL